ncbi:hypothetical protein OCK74_03455 [Chitinophagaceae bacterium LB-8]|uniref:Uncharacterized protein n=1 Tax=Paraflavisolibacter caeni TaxID=2982496 RepID=A0A9X3B763_9BACT|nr:hypothetical protein [Paraflavisolibacter caeni]MCU7548151.1 hypothetical protein [Paraflavisolibacter caeni]
MNTYKQYTAVDLIEKIIEFTKMTPNPKLWKEGLLKESPPRYVRLRQINALTKALFSQRSNNFLGKAKSLLLVNQLPTINALLSGSFIKGKNIREYEGIIAMIKTTVRENEGQLGETGEITHKHLIDVYQRLMKYKKQLMDLLHFNDGESTSAPIGLRFTVYLTNEVSSAFEGKYARLDEALALIIDPNSLTFTEEELQAEYNYPKEDIREVDKNFP